MRLFERLGRSYAQFFPLSHPHHRHHIPTMTNSSPSQISQDADYNSTDSTDWNRPRIRKRATVILSSSPTPSATFSPRKSPPRPIQSPTLRSAIDISTPDAATPTKWQFAAQRSRSVSPKLHRLDSSDFESDGSGESGVMRNRRALEDVEDAWVDPYLDLDVDVEMGDADEAEDEDESVKEDGESEEEYGVGGHAEVTNGAINERAGGVATPTGHDIENRDVEIMRDGVMLDGDAEVEVEVEDNADDAGEDDAGSSVEKRASPPSSEGNSSPQSSISLEINANKSPSPSPQRNSPNRGQTSKPASTIDSPASDSASARQISQADEEDAAARNSINNDEDKERYESDIRIIWSDMPSDRRKKTAKAEYINLLNQEIRRARERNIYDASYRFAITVGGSNWKPAEQDTFFNLLAVIGKDDVGAIANAVKTKSVVECRAFLQILADATVADISHAIDVYEDRGPVTAIDVPAAVEISEECIAALEEEADFLEERTRGVEEQAEKVRLGDNWLVHRELAMRWNKMYDDGELEELEKIAPEAGLINVFNMVELSEL